MVTASTTKKNLIHQHIKTLQSELQQKSFFTSHKTKEEKILGLFNLSEKVEEPEFNEVKLAAFRKENPVLDSGIFSHRTSKMLDSLFNAPPSMPTPYDHIAKWGSKGPAPDLRIYFDFQQKEIDTETTGENLPVNLLINKILAKNLDIRYLLQNSAIYTNLPNKFLLEFFKIQDSSTPITTLPKMNRNKNVTVKSCMKNWRAVRSGNWQTLGWPSEDLYKNWLSKNMLEAFSGIIHYCESKVIFDYHSFDDKKQKDVFKASIEPNEDNQVSIAQLHKLPTLPIISTALFDFRNFKYAPVTEQALPEIVHNKGQLIKLILDTSKQIIQHILNIARMQNIKQIVFVPVGMGVFLGPFKDDDEIKNALLDGMNHALMEYHSSPMTIIYCGPDIWFERINKNLHNKNISMNHKPNLDAYHIAVNENKKGIKTAFINAGDQDWIAQLSPKGKPGQGANYHTLHHSTADEYLGLMTTLPLYSIENLIKYNRLESIIKPFFNIK